MKIHLHDGEDITFSDFDDPGFDIITDDPETHYSALQMFATSLALCTYSVLISYAEQIDTATHRLSIRVRWDYVEHPYRIGHIDMQLHWPELPESRLKAAERAASLCTLHNTLHNPPEIKTTVDRKASEGG